MRKHLIWGIPLPAATGWKEREENMELTKLNEWTEIRRPRETQPRGALDGEGMTWDWIGQMPGKGLPRCRMTTEGASAERCGRGWVWKWKEVPSPHKGRVGTL